MCRYTTQDTSGINPLETITINNYEGSRLLYNSNNDISKVIDYNSTQNLTTNDIDNSEVLFNSGKHKCNLDNPFSKN